MMAVLFLVALWRCIHSPTTHLLLLSHTKSHYVNKNDSSICEFVCTLQRINFYFYAISFVHQCELHWDNKKVFSLEVCRIFFWLFQFSQVWRVLSVVSNFLRVIPGISTRVPPTISARLLYEVFAEVFPIYFQSCS